MVGTPKGIRPAHVVPTVLPGGRNVSQTHRLRKITQHFVDLIDRNRANKDFISLLRRPGQVDLCSKPRQNLFTAPVSLSPVKAVVEISA